MDNLRLFEMWWLGLGYVGGLFLSRIYAQATEEDVPWLASIYMALGISLIGPLAMVTLVLCLADPVRTGITMRSVASSGPKRASTAQTVTGILIPIAVLVLAFYSLVWPVIANR